MRNDRLRMAPFNRKWIAAVAAGHGASHGNWWNGTVWSECRARARDFLLEIGERWPDVSGTASDLAARYGAISEALGRASDRDLPADAKIGWLKDAAAAEAASIAGLEELATVIVGHADADIGRQLPGHQLERRYTDALVLVPRELFRSVLTAADNTSPDEQQLIRMFHDYAQEREAVSRRLDEKDQSQGPAVRYAKLLSLEAALKPMVLSTLASNISYYENVGGIPVLRQVPVVKDLLRDIPLAPFKQGRRQKGFTRAASSSWSRSSSRRSRISSGTGRDGGQSRPRWRPLRRPAEIGPRCRHRFRPNPRACRR